MPGHQRPRPGRGGQGEAGRSIVGDRLDLVGQQLGGRVVPRRAARQARSASQVGSKAENPMACPLAVARSRAVGGALHVVARQRRGRLRHRRQGVHEPHPAGSPGRPAAGRLDLGRRRVPTQRQQPGPLVVGDQQGEPVAAGRGRGHRLVEQGGRRVEVARHERGMGRADEGEGEVLPVGGGAGDLHRPAARACRLGQVALDERDVAEQHLCPRRQAHGARDPGPVLRAGEQLPDPPSVAGRPGQPRQQDPGPRRVEGPRSPGAHRCDIACDIAGPADVAPDSGGRLGGRVPGGVEAPPAEVLGLRCVAQAIRN